jgi:putative hemolysin
MLTVFLIAISLLAVAFFAGVETAYIRANKLHFELKRQQGSERGRILSNFTKHEHEFLVTLLVGNAIILVLIGKQMDAAFGEFLHSHFPDLGKGALILLTTVVTTAIVLFFAEFLPKALFSINPSGILYVLAMPIYWIYSLLRPIVWFFYYLAKKILGLFTIIDQSTDDITFGTEDLKHFINAVPTNSDGVDTELIRNTLNLADASVGDCMVPRPYIVAFDVNDEVNDIYKLFEESGHSKLLIYDDTLDDTLGYVHHSQMLHRPTDIRPLIVATLVVPEVMSAVDLMNRFIRDKKNMAVVVDEFGGTAGIITLEDILEEIFGEIDDEHDDLDTENMTEEILSERSFRFDGRLEIEHLNTKYNLNLPEEDYTTLSGYIVQTHESIPTIGESFRIKNYEFVVEKRSDTRIEIVKMTRILNE